MANDTTLSETDSHCDPQARIQEILNNLPPEKLRANKSMYWGCRTCGAHYFVMLNYGNVARIPAAVDDMRWWQWFSVLFTPPAFRVQIPS